MKTKFEKGDIVKFKDESNVRPDMLYHFENIYQIKSIEGTKVSIGRDFAFEIETDLSELESVKIDGVEDRFIYYDPIVAASIVMPGQPVPVFRKNYTYYLDNNSLILKQGTMRDIVNKNGFSDVHELQHYLRKIVHSDDLKIHI